MKYADYWMENPRTSLQRNLIAKKLRIDRMLKRGVPLVDVCAKFKFTKRTILDHVDSIKRYKVRSIRVLTERRNKTKSEDEYKINKAFSNIYGFVNCLYLLEFFKAKVDELGLIIPK